jgi:hypothetical protein
LACCTAISACARPAKAENTSAKLIERVRKNECSNTSGLPASSKTNWTAFCNDLARYLPTDFATPSFVTTSSQSGEIGWRYNSSAVFTNRSGMPQKVTFSYTGEGYLANKPKLTGVDSSIGGELIGQRVYMTGSEKSISPGAEEVALVAEIRQLLVDQQCETLPTKAFDGLSDADSSSGSNIEELCTRANAHFAGSNLLIDPVFRINQYSYTPPQAGSTTVAPAPDEQLDQVLEASLRDATIQLIRVNGGWYLNGLRFRRTLFSYEL